MERIKATSDELLQLSDEAEYVSAELQANKKHIIALLDRIRLAVEGEISSKYITKVEEGIEDSEKLQGALISLQQLLNQVYCAYEMADKTMAANVKNFFSV